MKFKKGKKPLKKAKRLPDTESEKVKNEAGATQITTNTDEENLDYGGLPAIDLKKNLGCG